MTLEPEGILNHSFQWRNLKGSTRSEDFRNNLLGPQSLWVSEKLYDSLFLLSLVQLLKHKIWNLELSILCKFEGPKRNSNQTKLLVDNR